MRLSISLLLPVLIGAAHAVSDSAKVYIFSSSRPGSSSNTPDLSPEEARLVVAQRLGVSHYHSLNDASDKTLSYINDFGGEQTELFATHADHKPMQLVIFTEGWTSQLEQSMVSSWGTFKPDFRIMYPPSEVANKAFVRDMIVQSSGAALSSHCGLEQAVNPFQTTCWAGQARIMHLDMKSNSSAFLGLQDEIRTAVAHHIMDVVLVAMPESTRKSKHSPKSYGSYDMPIGSHNARAQIEEPMADGPKSSSAHPLSKSVQSKPIQTASQGRVSLCHTSLDLCSTSTGNCSGHGSCYLKYGTEDNGCFTCGCKKTVNEGKTTYWGGAACAKEDVSSQFWLLAGFSVLLIGIVGWAIGMMFAIGEEKLPGVIGAGVSGPKAR
ncbi:MAG: hypothetical protein M1818_001950 [Claussenomyces sp. TS43310]|nr:MAG: hypothetical protein M1818_001950 [Claussenomyces sp. TS43310]